MFIKRKHYKHKNMKDVHFEVRLVEWESDEGVKLFVTWYNDSMKCEIGPEQIFVKKRDIHDYVQLFSDDELGGYGEDMS